jgi:hypothetical protein
MMPQLSDMQLTLDLRDSAWKEYKKRQDYADIILRAEKIVDKYLELQLRYGFNTHGPLQQLTKKFGWTEEKKARACDQMMDRPGRAGSQRSAHVRIIYEYNLSHTHGR